MLVEIRLYEEEEEEEVKKMSIFLNQLSITEIYLCLDIHFKQLEREREYHHHHHHPFPSLPSLPFPPLPSLPYLSDCSRYLLVVREDRIVTSVPLKY